MLKWVFSIFLLGYSTLAIAQFRGNNLLEYQFGKLPTDTVSSFSTVYDRLVMDYTLKKFKFGATLETFYSPFDGRSYIRPNQVRLQYRSKGFEVKLGNFYETIGRGSLLRSFEIPGAILEDITFRSRHYFNRDVAGALVKYRHKKFSGKLLYGSPLNNIFPTNQPVDVRRSDRIGAVYLDYQVGKQTIGAGTMNLTNELEDNWYVLLTGQGKIIPQIDYYTEFSRNVNEDAFFDFDDDASFSFYANMNVNIGNFGLTAEYKNYKNFVLGSGINEPPAAVKQHTYRTLNRSTHVLQPLNESGYQLEMYYYLPSGSVLTLNHTRASNDFGMTFTFMEYFGEYDFFVGKHNFKIFADFAQDPFKLESDRISTGAYLDWKLGKKTSLDTEYEYQTFEREGVSITNQLLQLTFNYTSRFSLGFIGEYSTDNFIVEDDFKLWMGATSKIKINNKNTLYLFGGNRRGGPACNSGVCYEVLDFEGVEVRLTSRF